MDSSESTRWALTKSLPQLALWTHTVGVALPKPIFRPRFLTWKIVIWLIWKHVTCKATGKNGGRWGLEIVKKLFGRQFCSWKANLWATSRTWGLLNSIYRVIKNLKIRCLRKNVRNNLRISKFDRIPKKVENNWRKM